MGRLAISTAMTVDGVMSVAEWFRGRARRCQPRAQILGPPVRSGRRRAPVPWRTAVAYAARRFTGVRLRRHPASVSTRVPFDRRRHVSTATSIITGVDFVSFPTNDLDAAMEFYGDVLGLPRSSLWQRPGEQAVGAEFETGTVTVALVACGPLGITFQPNKAPLALRVDDVEAARTELESRGVSSPPRRSTAASATWRPSRIPTATR